MKNCLSIACAIALLSAGTASGSVVAAAFDVNSGGSPTESGFVATSGNPPSGTSNGVGLQIVPSGVQNSGFRDRGTGGALGSASQQDLMRDFIFWNGNTQTSSQAVFTLDGLFENVPYDITYYTYNQGAFQREMSVFEGTNTATTPLLTHTTPGNTPDEGNFTFRLNSDSNGEIVFTGVGTDLNGSSVIFNGLSLAVPEPSSALLVSLGGGLFMLRRRR